MRIDQSIISPSHDRPSFPAPKASEENLIEPPAIWVDAQWLRCYRTEDAVQCSPRLLDATWAGSSACQTLQTPAVSLQPQKFWQVMQRGRKDDMCASQAFVQRKAQKVHALSA
jgi:hypothetical protein